MKTNITLIVVFLLSLTSCFKSSTPDLEDYRDSELYGTWVDIAELKKEKEDEEYSQEVYVYDKGGYSDRTSVSINSSSGNIAYGGLGGIWYVVNKQNANNIIHVYSSLRIMNNWDRYYEYYIKEDTLYSRRVFPVKDEDWTKFIKHKYQIIYDEDKYVGIDSTWTK